MKCSISGCVNTKYLSDKYFFCSPRTEARKKQWENVIGKTYGKSSTFVICEDHFDVRQDYEFYKVNGAPFLKTSACPHRNLNISDMKLQSKIDKINWRCFVPDCGNERLMANKKIVFFPVPEEGTDAMLWNSAAMLDQSYLNTTSDDEMKFCCEEHFDIDKDVDKIFRLDGMVEFKVKPGIVPSLRLIEQKFSDEPKRKSLVDSVAHPRMILNNQVFYFYDSELPPIAEVQHETYDIINLNDIKIEPDELANLGYIKVEIVSDDETCIKTESMDLGYEEEFNVELVIKREEREEESKSHETESESESSSIAIGYKGYRDEDPDMSSVDFSSETDDSISDDSYIEDDSDSNEESDLAESERFECPHCKMLVRNLQGHVERVHLSSGQNLNKSFCGLCWQQFESIRNLKDHQNKVHNGNGYGCDLCNFMSPVYQKMRDHIISMHSSEKHFLCQRCGMTYKFMKDLKLHIRKHLEVKEQRHACHLCVKKFIHQSSLKLHIQAGHLHQRPFECTVDGCNKKFGRKSNLRQHQQVHNDEKPLFQCIICKKKFTFKWNLNAHIKNVHET